MSAGPPWHAHVYFTDGDRTEAAALRSRFVTDGEMAFIGRMTDGPVGPHPVPQFEVHFYESSRPTVVAAIEASGLRALVHPLTDDDLADHTTLGHWIGEPLALNLSVLDAPGSNRGIARFGKADF